MRRLTPESFLNHLRERVLVFDGAMGSNLQTLGLTSDDFGGRDGCSEALVLFAPSAIRRIHREFLAVGCRAVETNTFGATRLVLQDHQLADRVAEINRVAVRLAREAMEEAPARDGSPRFVAGSIGPTSKIPSLGQISFADMAAAYEEQVQALWDGGVDLLLIETCQDLLQTKAALAGARRVFRREGARLPVMVSVTLEAAGTMLVGSDIGVVQAVLEPFPWVDVIGINCATGPLEMVRHVEFLARTTRKPISIMPNAGLPENVGGKAVYRLRPEELASYHRTFVTKDGAAIVGGCCGTTPAHLAAVVEAVGHLTPRPREVVPPPTVASLYGAVSLRQDPPPCLVGERTNANGSRQFRDLLLKNDLDGMIALGREQARGGAHLLDLSTAYVGRDEKADMAALVPHFARQVKLPLLIDSTDPATIEAALERHGGRCLVNSVNLEDGGKKLREVAAIAQEHGAALICLAIDEQGMARAVERKLAVIRRLFALLTGEFGFRPCDLIFDPLTFTVGSGDPDLRTAAIATLEAVEQIGREFPDSFTLLGVSNVSFGLHPDARVVLNSLFLAEAVRRGLSLAIVHPAGILPTFRIPHDQREAGLALLFNRSGDGSDLARFMALFQGGSSGRRAGEPPVAASPEERLQRQILDGDKSGLPALLDSLLSRLTPEEVINEHLIKGMRAVGELFGRGEMQLPFVLQSAEVVKAAVGYLEPRMARKPAEPGKTVVLATVRGDVHDIGKNLVNILLTNNGYRVIDLGIKVDVDTMIRAAQEHAAGVIGMSGLLVRSTQVMRENLAELNRRGLPFTVVLGGAALTREFVEQQLQPEYAGRVFYAADAFEGLTILERLAQSTPAIATPTGRGGPAAAIVEPCPSSVEGAALPSGVPGASQVSAGGAAPGASQPCESSGLAEGLLTNVAPPPVGSGRKALPPPPVIEPPFWGVRTLEIGIDDLADRLDPAVLFQARWKFERGQRDEATWQAQLDREARPALERLLGELRQPGRARPRACYAYVRARADGDRLRVRPPRGGAEVVWQFPRSARPPHLALSDFVADDRDDLLVLWAVTMGPEAEAWGRRQFVGDRYREYFLWFGLLAELADGGAEFVQAWVTREVAAGRRLDRIPPARARLPLAGTRFSFGYPACPDLAAQHTLLSLLEAETIGITLTESSQMVPETSVAGLLFLNPHAHYFAMAG
ncbi:MAG: 5-methyltetrahydrofolate--homocysteine methyltransferase [Candidatus Ozemobacter sibiricus]|uniref:Methionine synthase n=1 Tax=Candidatus Ozemobacter sibiricus TaxID=2268124 RepID=A0A367ZPR1_9BACT|nr:MAG: 5-methyltetrahydrofolate--homocysteine methyltransferase [Candidatus Ozemobacter sibiricus]